MDCHHRQDRARLDSIALAERARLNRQTTRRATFVLLRITVPRDLSHQLCVLRGLTHPVLEPVCAQAVQAASTALTGSIRSPVRRARTVQPAPEVAFLRVRLARMATRRGCQARVNVLLVMVDLIAHTLRSRSLMDCAWLDTIVPAASASLIHQ